MIILAVIVLGIFTIIGIITTTVNLSEFVSIFSLVVAALALYYAKRVRGPEFNLTEARITDRTTDTRVLIVLIQNIGDRMGYFRWDKINLKVKEKLFEPKVPKDYRGIIQAHTQEENTFHFFVEPEVDLTGGYFVTEGVYSNHKGKGMIKDTWKVPLSGKLKPKEKKEERRIEDES